MLIYLGGGHILGVPARNLTEAEAKIHGRERLLASGLYKEQAKPKPSSNKAGAGPAENKEEGE